MSDFTWKLSQQALLSTMSRPSGAVFALAASNQEASPAR